MESIAEGGNGGNPTTPPATAPSPNRRNTSMQREERDSTPASGRGGEADAPAVPSLQRAGTLPIRRNGVEREENDPGTRRRGRTISSNPRNLDPHPLSPRSQMFGRKLSTNSGENNRE
jgi:aquaglyceroporin related protein